MMSGEIDALYIYDELHNPLVEQVYRSRPPSAAAILPLYQAHPAPRPSLLYIPDALPPVTVFSIVQSNLLFVALSEVDTDPLLALEFLHRAVDVLEEFIGAPLLSSKLQANYDVAAQLLNEMCDGGIVCNTELNALQEVVQMPGWMGKLLGGVGLAGSSTPILGPSNISKPSVSPASANLGPAIPWRRPGVRHTSNELYVDIIESLSVVMAPSGRLLSALVSGTIVFNAKISGVPELLLSLTAPGGQQGIARKVELPVFHPCVKLAKWRERPGELNFVPPDGRFILAGYEVNLLPVDPSLDEPPSHMEKLFLPAFVDIRKSLGPTGSDFEVRLVLNTNFPGYSSFNRPGAGRGGSGTSTPSFLGGGGNSSLPALEDVVVSVPLPKSVRNIIDMQASRGDAMFISGSNTLEWRVPTKDAGTVTGTATLRCTVTGHQTMDDDIEDDAEEVDTEANLLQGYYDPSASASYQDPGDTTKRKTKKKKKKKGVKKSSKATAALDADRPHSSPDPSQPQTQSSTPHPSSPAPPIAPTSSSSSPFSIFHTAPRKTKSQLKAGLMPSSASVSFSVKGWLPSGIKIDSLNIDPRRSRGLGEGVKPYKGVKYMCVSRKGVERRV
ncbi:putative AP-3 adaptor complex subunit MU [Aspergillus taichungensis]|uniref:Putative AP-3 adaptor complex subunit MU n=1 Tax=Aspergillus taichungensis TaxID=482145 RepID=A0A2J5I2I7_9EURO|nr:putative AP-3 adaptor complex subunit MU [Aspergillus taichungensis]